MKIAINNHCNSKCSYCFAGTMGLDKDTHITLDNFKKMLDIMVVNEDKFLVILGREPTLHPNFKDIIRIANDYARRYQWNILLLTNGVMLEKYIDLISDKTNILVNVNNEKILGEIQYEKMKSSLKALKDNDSFEVSNNDNDSQATLGCNLHLECTDYNFFWEQVDAFNVKNVRVSVTTPANNEEALKDRDSYFKQMKSLFFRFR